MLLLHFFSISGSIWASFFRCFPKQRKFTKTYKNQCIFNDFASQTPSFFGLFFVDFSCFVRNPSWRAFLAPKTATYTPKVYFWSRSGFPGVPKMALGATILSQKGSKWRVLFTARCDLEPTMRFMTRKTAPRKPFLQFGIDFGPILAPFLMDLGSIWDDHLGICRKLLVTCFEFV